MSVMLALADAWVSYDDYATLYAQYERARATAVTLYVLFLVALIVGLTLAVLYGRERTCRRALQAELDRQTGPDHQLALIRSLGTIGRDEMQRTVAEAQRALLTIAEGARR